MEKKNGDGGEEEEKEKGREQLTPQQNKHYSHRPLSNCISIDYQVSFVIYSFGLFFSLNIFFQRRSIEILNVRQLTIMIIVIHQLFFHLNVFPYNT
jgi:hypothetical protein